VAALLLAHQGGWDEILLVLTPIALFAGLLWLANTRANRELQRRKAAAAAAAAAAEEDETEG
jgi:cyanate permease